MSRYCLLSTSKGLYMTAFRVCLSASFCVVRCGFIRFAETIFNVRDHGAVGDGMTLDTDAVQKAFNECGKARRRHGADARGNLSVQAARDSHQHDAAT